MKVVLQRVSEATVVINEVEVASIKKGLLILLGIVDEDKQDDIDWLFMQKNCKPSYFSK